MSASRVAIQRLDFGCFVRPGAETRHREDHLEPVLGYLVRHPRGVLLVDTGMGSHPDVDRHYRPRRVELGRALAAASSRVEDIAVVTNCHLHFDHCGNNPGLPGRPIFVQTAELSAARGTEDYTLPHLVDAPGLVYEEVAGDAEVWEGVTIIPTPGHTAGHQSVVVRSDDGTVVVLAGQSYDTASQYSADALAVRAADDGQDQPLPVPPAWIRRLQALDPAKVYFAHDHAIWVPE